MASLPACAEVSPGGFSDAPPSEAEIIARAQCGDHAAFDVLYERYRPQIYDYIYRRMGNANDADEMTQDTFLKAYLNLPKTDDNLKFGAWLYRIATNVCLDELRHRKLVKWQRWDAFISVFHPSQVAKDNPEREVLKGEDYDEVRAILDQLYPKYRMCLILREYHDMSYDEMADALSITHASVKSLLHRAREQFGRIYGARGGVIQGSAPSRRWHGQGRRRASSWRGSMLANATKT